MSEVRDIVNKFTLAGLEITNANYATAWYRNDNYEKYELAFASPNLPFEPVQPRDNGLRNQVENMQAAHFVSEIVDYTNFDDLVGKIKSFVIIPVSYKNYIYGNIVFYFAESKFFSDEEKSLCSAIGNSAAQAITIRRLVTSEQEARVDAENQKNRFQALIENSYDIVALLSPEGEILYVSPPVTKITGYSQEALLGRNMAEFIYDKDLPLVVEHLMETIRLPENPQIVEFRYWHKDGSLRWFESTKVNMLDDPSIGSIVSNIRDITERKQAHDTIIHQALHDPLTNLPNRKEFIIRLEQATEIAKRHNRKMALMFLDIDRFKNINDSLGHAVGDTLLKVIARRFEACVRSEDTVARLGGDEFLILLNEVHSSQDAVLVAEKILKATAIPVQINEHTFHPTVSIGIAMYPHDGEDSKNLKKHADIALYRAKKNGRNCYSLYDPSLDTYATEKFALENELREAMSLNQIILYYQPIISLKNGRIISMEALVRWQHPSKGLLLPDQFIPLAEETGLISSLSEYILVAACRQHKIWQAGGFPKFRIAINMCAKNFTEDEFIPQLAQILEEYNMEPSCLEMEITETMAMENLEQSSLNLKQLKKMGVRVSIDDFGTGYSSLSYLKRFPISSLKIDRSFVRQCIANDQDASIVRAIISMAHSLNLKVIAEGVETDQQLNFLASLGCNGAQGFYIAHPMPEEKLSVWLEEKHFKKKQVPVPAVSL